VPPTNCCGLTFHTRVGQEQWWSPRVLLEPLDVREPLAAWPAYRWWEIS
jgi:hypothetical protein